MTQQQVADSAVEAAARRVLEALGSAAGQKSYAYGYKHDASGTPISVGYVHGPGGSLTYPGVDPEVFSTIVGAQGIIGQLPAVASVLMNPTFEVITGVGADSGAEKDGVCDDAVTAGLITGGILTSVFGRYERQTPELEINRLGQRVDRADPIDLRLANSPIATGGLFGTGPAGNANPAGILANEIQAKFVELAFSLQRMLTRQLWTGSPANNAAGGGYKELTGFDLLINTGHRDAITGMALPAVDSDVKDFHYLNVEDHGPELVDALMWIYYTRRDLAIRSGMGAVRWVYVMRPELFHVIASIWPCAYYTYQCGLSFNDAARVNIDATAQSRLRDDMMEGRYLIIEGQRIEVVFDDGIPEETQTQNGNVPPAAFSSSIYFIPMSIQGGRAVTYLEYMDYSNPSVAAALNTGLILGRADGPWFTVPKQTNFCFQFQTKIEPRLIMRTPWLAGRLDHVVASPLQRTRSPFPDDPYYVGGGVGTRPGPSYTHLWS